jgi:TfoX/Sxy family transcriptional regulator of competence genes
MASDQSCVDYLCEQAGLGSALTSKKMFGEFALYLEGRVIAFVCDNQLFVKPTPEGKALLGTVSEHPPYPGAKLYFRIADEVDDRELLKRLFVATAHALPLPKPKSKPAKRNPPKVR